MYNTSKYFSYIYADRNVRPCTIQGYTLATFPKIAQYIYAQPEKQAKELCIYTCRKFLSHMSMNGLSFTKGSVEASVLSLRCILDKMHSKFILPMYFLKKGVLMFGFRDQYFVTFGFLINPITMT